MSVHSRWCFSPRHNLGLLSAQQFQNNRHEKHRQDELNNKNESPVTKMPECNAAHRRLAVPKYPQEDE
jgi:hypothetical protein